MNTTGKSYPSDVTDGQWEFLLPYFALMREDAPQQKYPPRTPFNALRYVVKTSVQSRYLPHDFPPWQAVYQQARRRLEPGAPPIPFSGGPAVLGRIAERQEALPFGPLPRPAFRYHLADARSLTTCWAAWPG